MPDDFQAEHDLHVLVESDEIRRDTARIARAKGLAERRRDQFDRMAKSLPGKKPGGINGAVRNSKMER